MKRRFLLLICLLATTFALVAAQSSPTPTPTPTPSVSVVIGLDVFVRGGPGRQYVPVGKLVLADRVTPLSRNTSADWVLITYNIGYGWVRRDLVTWAENIDLLPILDEGNLTPSPGVPFVPQQTLIFLPTNTPLGNWVELVDAPSGYVRAGPGRTYLRLGQLPGGAIVEPVGRNADTVWIMIRFLDGFGWVRSDLVNWVDDLTRLPVVSPENLTPTATFTPTNTATPTATATNTATPTLTPSQTPSPIPTDTPTLTYTPTVTPSPLPTNTATSTATSTFTNTPLPTVTNTSLPSATPTSTVTLTDIPLPTATNTPTSTATSTFTNTPLPTVTNTSLPSAIPTSTVTLTDIPLPTATNTLLPTVTLTSTPLLSTSTILPVIVTETAAVQAIIATKTPLPTAVNTVTLTYTPTFTATPTLTVTSTNTVIPASATALPTNSPTNTSLLPSATLIPASSTPVPSATTVAVLATGTPHQPIVTFTQGANIRSGPSAEFNPPIGSIAAGQTAEILAQTAAGDWYKILYNGAEGWVFSSLVAVSGNIDSIPVESSPPLPFTIATVKLPTLTVSPSSATSTASVAIVQNPTDVPQPTPVAEPTPSSNVGLPIEAVVGGLALLLVLTYIAFYWRGLAAAERYAKGFAVHTCPACDRGDLVVETKQDRLLGIPRPRRTVRCSQCRSVLREVGNRRWRYAVDPMENPALYQHYNGREIDDATLIEIARQPHSPNGKPVQTRLPITPPSFTDNEDT